MHMTQKAIFLLLLFISRPSAAGECLGLQFEFSNQQSLVERTCQRLEQDFSELFRHDVLTVMKANPLQIFTQSRYNYSAFIFPEGSEQLKKPHLIIHQSLLTSDQFYPIFFHELIHWVHHLITPNEKDWVKEGIAQLFEYFKRARLNTSLVQIEQENFFNDFFTPYRWDGRDHFLYAKHFYYFYYLYSQCGGIELIKSLLLAGNDENFSQLRGIALIDAVLKAQDGIEICSDFEQSFVASQIARVHNQTQFINFQEDNTYRLHPQIFHQPAIQNTPLDLLKNNTPYLLTSDQFQEFSSCQNCHLYYLQQQFPYQVIKADDSLNNSNWLLFLLKYAPPDH